MFDSAATSNDSNKIALGFIGISASLVCTSYLQYEINRMNAEDADAPVRNVSREQSILLAVGEVEPTTLRCDNDDNNQGRI